MEDISLEEKIRELEEKIVGLTAINEALKRGSQISSYELVLKANILDLENENQLLRNNLAKAQADLLKELELRVNMQRGFEDYQKKLAVDFMQNIDSHLTKDNAKERIQSEVNRFIFKIQHCNYLYKS
ncbi:MAG: hypothetical protein IKC49_03135 [Clostridia bacterium]|nr:hypothetical protein [Clostridia bacterium]